MTDRDGTLRLGPLFLHWSEVAAVPRRAVAVDLRGAAAQIPVWLEHGGILAAQALWPLADFDQDARRGLELLCAGPGTPLAALVGLALGLKRCACVPPAADAEPLRAAAAAQGRESQLQVHAALEEIAPQPAFHRVMLGAGGATPSLADCQPLVQRLRPEGLLILFGFPAADQYALFDQLAGRGWSLRAAGSRGSWAFLAGSLGARRDFAGG